jgi:hypothetical protein
VSSADRAQKIARFGASLQSGTTLQGWMLAMADDVALAPAGGAGRPRRPRAPRRQLKARVCDEAVQRAHRRATALGVTMAEYVEALLLHDEPDEDGRPLWWTRPVPADQKELPLKSA